MPFTTFLLAAFALGIGAALAGAHELRLSPRHALLSGSFGVLMAFVGLLLVPISAYFYIFHGDWFMLYLVEVRRVPSALALIGFVLEALLGVLGFMVGATLVRNQRSPWAIGALVCSVVAALAVVPACAERLRVVGTYGQFRGGFGLASYGGALMQGTLTMGLLLCIGAGVLIYRIRHGAVR
ncbi:MAG TPA: hypothetical protein VF331_24140 [Polyangiales bacterium]